jgi:diaminohydroxyphosphoribosylaminopyrimidine deaminase/5-amino-6-(5-phosphoribosylamino)uracil reductase
VLTGSGTVLADDPALTVRDGAFAVGGHIRQPLRVVAGTRRWVSATAALFRGEGPVLLAHAAGAVPAVAAAEHVACGRDSVDLAALLAELGSRGCNEVLVEAGPRLVGAFLDAGLWDELLVYVAPKLLGSDARPMAELPLLVLDQAVAATIRDFTTVGGDLRLRLIPRDTSQA